MTIAATITAKQYTSNGVTLQYAFPNKIFSASDLVVTLIDLVGNRYPFTNFANATTGLSYTVQGVDVDTGCTVIFSGAQTFGWTVDIRSLIPDTQSTSIKNQGSFFPELHEEAFDRATRMIQDLLRLTYLYGIHGPDIETVPWPALPIAASRKGMALMFDALTGLPALGVPVTQTLTTGLLAPFLNLGVTAAETAAGVTIVNAAYPPGYIERYGADNTGAASSAVAGQAAFNQYGAGGAYPRAGPGAFLIDSQVIWNPAPGAIFIQGIGIEGAGRIATIFINKVANNAMFKIGSQTSNRFQSGARFKGFKIQADASAPAASIGIQVAYAFHTQLEDVWMYGMTADGLKLVDLLGDGDGPNMLSMRHCRFENCGTSGTGWGVNSTAAAGHNEISYVSLDDVFISACGAASAANPPTSGGMQWKGQILEMRNVAFTLNFNTGFFCVGGAGLPANVKITGFDFENNGTAANPAKAHVWIQGLDILTMDNGQFYSNDVNVSQGAVFLDGSASTIRNVNIVNCRIRATVGNNPYTAFLASGANVQADTVRIRQISWDNFDFAGQTRFSGIQFDAIQQQCEFVVLNTGLARLRAKQSPTTRDIGNTTPIRLRGGAGGTPSTSGEWVPTQIASAGINITNAGLVASTQYYAYLYDNNGAYTLELVTTVPVLDTASGYSVKTGDATRLYVGSVLTDAAINFLVGGPCVAPDVKGWQLVNYSASMTFDASLGNKFSITATDGNAFTINAPTNPAIGQRIQLRIRNTSGGALGAATFNAVFKLAAWVQPATGQSRSIDFDYDGSVWVEAARTPADVPN